MDEEAEEGETHRRIYPVPPPAGDGLPTAWLRRLLFTGVTAVVLCAVAVATVAIKSRHQPPETSVTKNIPLAISCPVVDYCMVVDAHGNALSYQRGRWSAPLAVDSNELEDVSCASPRFCVAVDINGAETTYRGNRWSHPVTIDPRAASRLAPGSDGLNAVACPVVAYCRAADATGRTLVFNGTHWGHRKDIEAERFYRPDPSSTGLGVIGLSCASASFCGAISESGSAEIYTDHTWSSDAIEAKFLVLELRQQLFPPLTGISCGNEFCVVVNSLGTTWVYSGGSWSKGPSYDRKVLQSPSSDGPTAISCVARTFCLAVDDSGNVSMFDGSSWSTPTRIDRTGLGLAAISCASERFCGALNRLGQVLILRGDSWSGPMTIDTASDVHVQPQR